MTFRLRLFFLFITLSIPYLLLSQASFGSINVINQTQQNGPTTLVSNDINGDGFLDIIVASTIDNKIAWYENLNGTGIFGEPIVIFDNSFDINLITLSDVDNDGHQDIIIPSNQEDAIFWLRNRGNASSFSSPKVINYLILNPRQSITADIDNDGLQDLINITEGEGNGTLSWQKNLGGTFGPAQVLSSDLDDAVEIHAADLDDDNDIDIIISETGQDRIRYCINTDGQGNFSSLDLLDENVDNVFSILTMDVDKDGRLDILTVSFSGGEFYWYKSDGNLNYSKRFISGGLQGAFDFISFDRDNDLDEDIFVAKAGENEIVYLDNLGNNNFSDAVLINEDALFPYELVTGDFDGNGFLDMASTSFFDDKISFFSNGGSSFLDEQRLSKTISGIKDIIKADIDQDGMQDLVTIATDISTISWYRNLGTEQGYGAESIITNTAGLPLCFTVRDMDGNGFPDIIYGGLIENHVSWISNLGNGIFANPVQIRSLDGVPLAVATGDLSDDGKLDIIVSSEDQNKVIWLRQSSQNVLAWPDLFTLLNNSGETTDIKVTDLDNDGDDDVIMAQLDQDRVIWHENLNNNSNFSQARIIVENLDGPRSFEMGDMDGDGIEDLVIAVTFDGEVVYLPRNGLTSNFGVKQVIASSTSGVLDIALADIDDDTFLDVAYLSSLTENIQIVYNTGTSFMAPQLVKSDISGASYIAASDIEDDGDQDLVIVTTGVERLFWIENLTNNNCFANDFEISTSECINDSFSIILSSFTNDVNTSLDFLITEATPDNVSIDSNQISFGVFDVNESPVWNIDVIDQVQNNCGNTYTVFSPLCSNSCELSNLSIFVGSCNADGSTFPLTIDLDASSAVNAGFDVLVDGNFYNYYLYSELPLTILDFPSNLAGSTTVTICDDDNPDCCISQEVATPCQCSYVNLSYEITACDTLTNEFFIEFDFVPVMTTGQGVLIGGNETTYGIFPEDSLPVVIGPLIADNTFYDFAFFDSGNSANCLSFISVGVIDCGDVVIEDPGPCILSNLNLSTTSCNPDGDYFINISFDADAPGDTGFTLTDDNGMDWGNFDYSSTNVQIGPFMGDCVTSPTIIITDQDDANCTTSSMLDTVICCIVPECKIENLTVTLSECTDQDTYTANFDFTVTDPGSLGFTIIGNGQNFGTFDYANLPLSLGGLASDCNTNPSFVIMDLEDTDCMASFSFNEPKCCLPDCDFSNFSIETTCSIDGMTTLLIDITPGMDLGSSFELIIDATVIGTFTYSDLPLTINHNVSLTDSTTIQMVDIETSCFYTETLSLSCSNCIIDIVDVTTGDCQENNNFSAEIEIASIGLGANGYNISVNGVSAGDFSQANGNIIIDGLLGDCETIYSFIATSLDDSDCTDSFEMNESICCIDCEITELSFDFIECTQNQEASFMLDFMSNDVAMDSFSLSINGNIVDEYAYGLLPLTVESLDLTDFGSEILIEVCDQNTDCCQSLLIDTPDCMLIVPCSIGGFSSDNVDCNFVTDQFTFDLNFIFTNVASDSFDLSGNLSNYGRFAYLDLPISIGPLDGDDITSYEYLVTDTNDSECSGLYIMGTVDCMTDALDNPYLEDLIIYADADKNLIINNISTAIDINIYDYQGRKVHAGFNEQKHDLRSSLDFLNTGIYILTLRESDTIRTVKLFLF